MKKKSLLFLSLLVTIITYAQVGIGTVTPDPSSMLDIQSDSQGLLIPRMTTIERNAIASPVESLLVFDTDIDAYFYYDTTTTTWLKILTNVLERDNYKLIKSAADLAPELAAGGSSYLLDENTYYEINGTINLTAPINLNNAYVSGLDVGEDILSFSGTVFEGDTGGSIRNVKITGGGTAFNITGAGGAASALLLVQNTIVDGVGDVGSISNIGVYFSNIVQFINNSDGITYSNIGNLLLNNQAWLDTNGGTYETFTGTFGLIEKVSGLSTVASGATGIDVSGSPTVGNGIIEGTVFSGGGSYINGYPAADTYPGYNFSVNWNVNAPGIPRESDDNASGNFYIQRNSTILNPSFSIAGGVPIDALILPGQMFRFSSSGTAGPSADNNYLQYEGKETRTFSVRGNLAYEPTTATGTETVHVFFIRRYNSSGVSQGVPLGTEVYEEVGVGTEDNLVRAIPLSGKVTLNPGDYVRIIGLAITQGTTARSDIRIYSVSLTLD